MDHRARLLLAWLEGEGERRRRKTPAPPELSYATWRGRVHVGVCALCGAVAGPLFVCWLAQSWALAGRTDIARELSGFGGGQGDRLTLEDARVEAVTTYIEGDAPASLVLTLRYRGLLVPCEFRGLKVPRAVAAGDLVTVRGRAGPAAGERGPGWLKDCELVGPPLRGVMRGAGGDVSRRSPGRTSQ